MQHAHNKIVGFVNDIVKIFKEADEAIPVGYTEEDVNVGAPKLYDQHFDILMLRLLSEIGMGLHTLHLNLAYRQDIRNFFKRLTEFTQDTYETCMDYLDNNKVVLRSPAMSPEKIVEFAKSKEYLSGLNPFNSKRTLNSVEAGHIYFAIESNSLGRDMITGFAQVANEPEVAKYCEKGKNLAQNIIESLSNILNESDIQAPITWGGLVTDSKIAPFSDKLMMYCVSLFCSFGLGSNAIGTAFSLRTDLPVKFINITKDVLMYAQNGAKLMAEHGWLEEPPQMANRSNVIH